MRSLFPALLLILCMTGCSPAKMAVSEDLKPAYDEYTVKGRQGILIRQKMSFGEFSTGTVQRSWTRGNDARIGIGFLSPVQMEWLNLISLDYINRKQTIRYELNSGGMSSQVFCVSRFNARDVELGKNPNSILNIGMDIAGIGGRSTSMYYVQIFAAGKDDRPWEMILDNQAAEATPNKYTGYLSRGSSQSYTIVPVTKMEIGGKARNTLAGTIGYEFRNKEGKTVAAVSLIDNGMVYLGRTTAEERFLLANACTALLLQEEIG